MATISVERTVVEKSRQDVYTITGLMEPYVHCLMKDGGRGSKYGYAVMAKKVTTRA